MNVTYIVVEPGLTYLVEGQKLNAKQYAKELAYFGEDSFYSTQTVKQMVDTSAAMR